MQSNKVFPSWHSISVGAWEIRISGDLFKSFYAFSFIHFSTGAAPFVFRIKIVCYCSRQLVHRTHQQIHFNSKILRLSGASLVGNNHLQTINSTFQIHLIQPLTRFSEYKSTTQMARSLCIWDFTSKAFSIFNVMKRNGKDKVILSVYGNERRGSNKKTASNWDQDKNSPGWINITTKHRVKQRWFAFHSNLMGRQQTHIHTNLHVQVNFEFSSRWMCMNVALKRHWGTKVG